MQITAIRGFRADCEGRGTKREVSLLLLKPDALRVGDYVLVYRGFALRQLSPTDATELLSFLDSVFAAKKADQEPIQKPRKPVTV